MKAMSSKFENHFEAASPTTQIGSMMMSGSAMCTTSDQSPRRVQRPIRQIGNCGKEEKIINENEYKSQREMLKFLINYMLVVHVYTLFLSFFFSSRTRKIYVDFLEQKSENFLYTH